MVDLCARLPYGVKFVRDAWNYEWDQEMSIVETLEDIDKDGYIENTKVYTVEDIKPYLHPMSSMSEEELKEFRACHCAYDLHPDFQPMMCTLPNETNMFDWLNSHHFDYRGLIEKGLALEAPEGMYDIK